MGSPLTTTSGRELATKVFYVNRGEQLAVRIYCAANTNVSWAGATCNGAIRSEAGGLIHTFDQETATVDDDGNATFLMAAEGTTTDDWSNGLYFANFSVTAGTNGPFHTKTYRVSVETAPVQP